MAVADRSSYFSRKVVFLNVMATILIVLLHSETPLRFGQELTLESYPFIFCVLHLTDVAVPLFFFISALLFYRKCEWQDIPTKLYRRIFSLLIPFLLWNLIFVAIYFALRKIPFTASRMNLVDSLDTAKDWLLAIWHTKFTPLWFIKYLIFFNLLSPAILLLIKNKWVGMTALLALLVAVGRLGLGSFSLWYSAPIYLAGALVGRYLYAPGQNDAGPLLKENVDWLKWIFIAAFAALYIVSLKVEGLVYWYKFAGPIIIWFAVDLLIPNVIGQRWTIKPWMGYTFFIYATHQFLLNVEQALVRSFLPGTPLVLNLTFIVTPVITILAIIFVASFFSKTKVYKVLTGGR